MSKIIDNFRRNTVTIVLTEQELSEKQYKSKIIYKDDLVAVYGALEEIKRRNEIYNRYHVIVISNSIGTDSYNGNCLNIKKQFMEIVNREAFFNRINGVNLRYESYNNDVKYSRFVKSVKPKWMD